MKMNSDAFTRVRCEYCPSGLPSASGLRILMSAILDSSCLRATANPLGELYHSTCTPLAIIGSSHFLTSLLTKSPSHCGLRSFVAATVAQSGEGRCCTESVELAPTAASLSFFTTSAGAPFGRNSALQV